METITVRMLKLKPTISNQQWQIIDSLLLLFFAGSISSLISVFGNSAFIIPNLYQFGKDCHKDHLSLTFL